MVNKKGSYLSNWEWVGTNWNALGQTEDAVRSLKKKRKNDRFRCFQYAVGFYVLYIHDRKSKTLSNATAQARFSGTAVSPSAIVPPKTIKTWKSFVCYFFPIPPTKQLGYVERHYTSYTTLHHTSPHRSTLHHTTLHYIIHHITFHDIP